MRFALALLSALLLILVHPRWNLWWLAPFAAVPLLYALAREWRPRHRFALGYAAGCLFWGGMCYWIHFVMDVHGKMGPWLGGVVFVLFCLLKGLHLGLFALVAGAIIHHRWAVLSIPAAWVVMERIPDPFGFMWLHLGNAALTLSLPLRLAPVTGVYGISFVFMVMATAVALLVLRRPRYQLAPALVVLLPVLMPAIPEAERGSEIAVAVQPNIPETDNWTWEMVGRMNNTFERLSLGPAAGANPRLVLWPEVPAPLYYEEDAGLRERIARIAATTSASVLMGTVAYNEKKAPLNAALMVAPDGRTVGRYDKMFLVPFGEYVPFPFGFIAGKVTNEIGDFVPGERIVTFKLDGETAGAFICYESAFPHLVRQFANRGATVLANLTNDGYFGNTAAREQHLALVRMRALENRRWILRAANDGITASIDPGGRVINQFPQFESVSGRLPFAYMHDLTLYTRWGDWFVWLCALVCAAALVASQWPHYLPEDAAAAQRRRRGRRA